MKTKRDVNWVEGTETNAEGKDVRTCHMEAPAVEITCDRSHFTHDICTIHVPTLLDPTTSTFFIGNSTSQVDFVLKHYKDLSPYLRKCKSLHLSSDFLMPQDMGDDHITNETTMRSTIVDYDEPMSSCCSGSSSSFSESLNHESGVSEHIIIFIYIFTI